MRTATNQLKRTSCACPAHFVCTPAQLHARDVALAEVRASAEVLGAANRELQAQLSSANRDLEARWVGTGQ